MLCAMLRRLERWMDQEAHRGDGKRWAATGASISRQHRRRRPRRPRPRAYGIRLTKFLYDHSMYSRRHVGGCYVAVSPLL